MDRISHFMCDYILASEKGRMPDAALNNRVNAIREAFREMHDGPQGQRKFAEAMTAQQFPLYFADALSRMFYKDYEYQTGEWKNYTWPDTAPDFRTVKRFRMTEPGTLYLRREKAESKATSIAESEVDLFVDEYARQFDISWQTLLNDDLGKLKETPARMARSCARFEDGFVSAAYDNATTQASMVALGLPYAFTGRLTIPNLAIAISCMSIRTDVLGNPLNLKKVYLVIPPVLKVQAAQILKDLIQYGGPASNVLKDFIAGVYVDPYITLNALAPANVPWYLFADPTEIPTVTVMRLQGYPAPWTAQKVSDVQIVTGNAPAAFTMGNFATGDIEYMVEDIIGVWNDATFVGVTDFRGLFYSSGTTP